MTTKDNKEKTIKTALFYYNYNIREHSQKIAYIQEISKAKQKTRLNEPFTTHYINFIGTNEPNNFLNKYIRGKDSVTIETEHLFNNQFNTVEGFRCFLWNEYVFENKHLKRGYYIEMTNELKNLLDNTFRCGYCGTNYTKKGVCSSCLTSEYLTPENLYLLQLKAISDTSDRIMWDDATQQQTLIKFNRAQTVGKNSRTAKKIIDLKERYTSDLKRADIEYKGFMWLLKNKVPLRYIENCIYYSHTNLFCFGWRNVLNFNEEQELKTFIESFPFAHEIKAI